MTARIRAGVVGVGHLGKHHARILNELGTAELIGVSDIDEKIGKNIAAKLNTVFYSDPEELFKKVQAVSIVTPTDTHYEVAARALNLGVNTLVEKPITNIPSQAEKLIQIAEDKNCILQVGHIERYNGAVIKAREYIKEPKFIEVYRLGRFSARSLDVGVVLDLMIHDIDIILSFIDSPVKTLSSIGTSVFTDREDIANCRLDFENGSVANLTASRVSYKNERKIRIFESDSYISLDYEKQKFVLYRKKDKKIISPDEVERIIPKIKKTEPLREELEDFLSSIRNNKTPAVGGPQGLTALKLAIKITQQL